MWIMQNVVVHQHDNQGLKVKEGEELNAAIAEQFNLGPLGLPLRDRHYIDSGRETVANMSAAEKKTWLHGIQIAFEVGEHEEETEVTQLRDAMLSWLATA